jgi:hypothetical protein
MDGAHNLTAMQLDQEARADFDLEAQWERSGLPEDFTITGPDEEPVILPERKPATKERTEKRKVA